jgi:hypothetical protein
MEFGFQLVAPGGEGLAVVCLVGAVEVAQQGFAGFGVGDGG